MTRFLTPDEIAEALGRSPEWVTDKLLATGKLPGFRVGAAWRVRPADFDAWVDQGIQSVRTPKLEEVPSRRRGGP